MITLLFVLLGLWTIIGYTVLLAIYRELFDAEFKKVLIVYLLCGPCGWAIAVVSVFIICVFELSEYISYNYLNKLKEWLNE